MARETLAEKLRRMTQIEREYWEKGVAVAGIDEVGRGPLAGPVVTACVVLPPDALIPGVDDSKKLSPARREALAEAILARAAHAAVARVEAAEIDEINILNATRRAMEACAAGAPAGVFLIDAVERMSPGIFCDETGSDKAICANIDLYSGFVYDMLDIPKELYTPLFAISRISGWSAHIIEEYTLSGRIMRPAYKSVVEEKPYVPLSER
jgi:hypothetical protein